MTNPLKIIGLLAIAAIVYVSWWVKDMEDSRASRVAALAECFDRKDFAPGSPRQASRSAFLRAIAVLHKNLALEPDETWYNNFRADVHWYLDHATAHLEIGDTERTLIQNAILRAYYDARQYGVLSTREGRQALAVGDAPQVVHGLFTGETLRIGYRLSPVLVPEVINHPANFLLQPALAWGLQQDRLDQEGMTAAQEFQRAGILSPSGWETVESYRLAADRKKN